MTDIDSVLKSYDFGEPKHKPDVLAQIKVIEATRAQATQPSITINQEGQPPVTLTMQDAANLLQQQQNEIIQLRQQAQPTINMTREGHPPITLTMQDAVNFIQQQQAEIVQLNQHCSEIAASLQAAREKLLQIHVDYNALPPVVAPATQTVVYKYRSKTEPEI